MAAVSAITWYIFPRHRKGQPVFAPDSNDRGKRNYGTFPRIPLSETLELLNVIHELGQGEKVRRVTAFIQLNRSPESGESRMLISASSSGYGLIEGGYQAPFLELTERGRQLVAPASEEQRRKAILEALFDNPIFSAYVSRYQGRPLPDDAIGAAYLRDMFSLSESEISTCLHVFRQNIRECGLTEEVIEAGVEGSHESTNGLSNGYEAKASVATIAPTITKNGYRTEVTRTIHRGTPQTAKIEPYIQMNLQIHLPENASPDVYEAIFRNIASYLMGPPTG